MSDDYRDLSPRQKARMMEQNLEVHNRRRRELGLERPAQSIRTPWDRGVDDTPAPAFYRDDEGLVDPDSRPPSWDANRRAARYRDGPPPPPPTAPLERQQLLKELERGHAFEQPPLPEDYPLTRQNRRPQRLVPPEVFEQMAGQSVSAPPITGYDPGFPEGSYTVQQPGPSRLSPSQKRRLRRQKGRGQQGQQTRPAPYPLPQDTPAPSYQGQSRPAQSPQATQPSYEPGQPVEPTRPEIPLHATCNTRATLIIDGRPVQFTCTMKPYPHPGQAHIVRLDPTPEAPEVFLGWWGPGE